MIVIKSNLLTPHSFSFVFLFLWLFILPTFQEISVMLQEKKKKSQLSYMTVGKKMIEMKSSLSQTVWKPSGGSSFGGWMPVEF